MKYTFVRTEEKKMSGLRTILKLRFKKKKKKKKKSSFEQLVERVAVLKPYSCTTQRNI